MAAKESAEFRRHVLRIECRFAQPDLGARCRCPGPHLLRTLRRVRWPIPRRLLAKSRCRSGVPDGFVPRSGGAWRAIEVHATRMNRLIGTKAPASRDAPMRSHLRKFGQFLARPVSRSRISRVNRVLRREVTGSALRDTRQRIVREGTPWRQSSLRAEALAPLQGTGFAGDARSLGVVGSLASGRHWAGRRCRQGRW